MKMRAQSEILGAIIIAFLIVFGMFVAVRSIQAEYNYLGSFSQFVNAFNLKRAENVLFYYNASDGRIYVKSSITSGIIGWIIFSNEAVYDENFYNKTLGLPQETWIPLNISQSSLAYITQYKNSSLGVITKYGNLFVFTPYDLPTMQYLNRTIFGAVGTVERTGSFKTYFVGNNTEYYLSYAVTGSGAYGVNNAGELDLSVRVSASNTWTPVIVFYTGSPSITETWLPNSNTFNLTITDGQGGRVSIQMNTDGSGLSKSISGLSSFKKMKLSISSPSMNAIGMTDVQLYKMPSSDLIAVVYLSTSKVYAGVATDMVTRNTVSVFKFVYTVNSILDGSSASITLGTDFATGYTYPASQYQYPSSVGLSINNLIMGGAYADSSSYSAWAGYGSDVQIFIQDQDTLGSTGLDVPIATPIISDLKGEGYLAFLDPPASLKMASGYTYTITSQSWSLNRNDVVGSNPKISWTHVSKTITLPNGYSITVSGNVSMTFSTESTHKPSGSGSTTPPSPSPASIDLFYFVSPMPTSSTPNDTTITIYTTTTDKNVISQLYGIYSVYNEDAQKFEISGQKVSFTLVSLPFGDFHGFQIFLGGDAKRHTDVSVYYGGKLIASGTYYNYLNQTHS
ncbi:MAG: hypothetical protein ACP5J1_06795 [Fervidicoccaceae archaeon]